MTPIKVQYSACKEHAGEIRNIICLHKECKLAPLICTLCREERHPRHQAIPLKSMLHQLSDREGARKSILDSCHEFTRSAEQHFENALLSLRNIVERFAQNVRTCEQKILAYYQAFSRSIYEETSTADRLDELVEQLRIDSGSQQAEGLISNLLVFCRVQKEKDLKGSYLGSVFREFKEKVDGLVGSLNQGYALPVLPQTFPTDRLKISYLPKEMRQKGYKFKLMKKAADTCEKIVLLEPVSLSQDKINSFSLQLLGNTKEAAFGLLVKSLAPTSFKDLMTGNSGLFLVTNGESALLESTVVKKAGCSKDAVLSCGIDLKKGLVVLEDGSGFKKEHLLDSAVDRKQLRLVLYLGFQGDHVRMK